MDGGLADKPKQDRDDQAFAERLRKLMADDPPPALPADFDDAVLRAARSAAVWRRRRSWTVRAASIAACVLVLCWAGLRAYEHARRGHGAERPRQFVEAIQTQQAPIQGNELRLASFVTLSGDSAGLAIELPTGRSDVLAAYVYQVPSRERNKPDKTRGYNPKGGVQDESN